MLSEHLRYLLNTSPQFSTYWQNLDFTEKKRFIELHEKIDHSVCGSYREIRKLHFKVHDETKRLFVKVQQKEFEYSRIPKDWRDVIHDSELQKTIYGASLSELNKFKKVIDDQISLYGGIKSKESLNQKISHLQPNSRGKRNFLEIWDVVRFRFVTPRLGKLVDLGVMFWEYYFDQIVSCRNYYFSPKNNDPNQPYRALHFHVEIIPNRIIEIQMMTYIRETTSHLEHIIHYQKSQPYLSKNHEQWLIQHNWKSNISDQKLEKGIF